MSSIERAMKEKPDQISESELPTTGEQDPKEEGPRASSEVKEAEGFAEDKVIDLDLSLLEAQGYLIPDSRYTRLREEYRIVKRPILTHAFSAAQKEGSPGNLIQITSPQVGEGKTFTVFNLAMSIVMEQDYTVLLIDGDLTRRHLSRLTGLAHWLGLTEILEKGGQGLGRAIVNTNVPNLRILPAGDLHPRSPELLASGHMKDLTDELATRYPDRVILFDSPPLLRDSQAVTLAMQAGQVLIVVESGRTLQSMVKESLNLLEDCATQTRLLLNKSPREPSMGYYYGRY